MADILERIKNAPSKLCVENVAGCMRSGAKRVNSDGRQFLYKILLSDLLRCHNAKSLHFSPYIIYIYIYIYIYLSLFPKSETCRYNKCF